MTLKEQMLYNAEKYDKKKDINEMAQQHLDNNVVDMIKSGDFEGAAQRYIDNHSGTMKPGETAGITLTRLKKNEFKKNLKADPDKVKQVEADEWDQFGEAYKEIMGTKGQTKRSYKKTKGKMQGETGEMQSAGQTKEGTIRDLENKMNEVYKEYQKQAANAENEEKRQEFEAHLEALETLKKGLDNTKKGQATLPPKTQEQLDKLNARYKKIGKNLTAKIEKDAEDEDDDEEGDEGKYNPKQAAEAVRRLGEKMRGARDLDDIEELIKDFRERQQAVAQTRPGSNIAATMQGESLTLQGKLLAESLEYKGTRFWENYIFSNLTRGFYNDMKEFGVNEALNIYKQVYGRASMPIFEYIADNRDVMTEVTKIKGTLLFETTGYNNLHTYLTEQGVASKVGSFLSGLWDKIKDLGAPIAKKLSKFVSQGADWAKNIAEKGLGFITNNPVAQVAVPAVALAGGVAGGIKLINKLRKKKGEKKLSKEEEEKMKQVAKEKEDQLEKYDVDVENEKAKNGEGQEQQAQ